MNILFLDSIDKNTYGGMEEWIRLVASGLAERGHAVTVAGRIGSEFLRRVDIKSNKVRILGLKISGDFNPATISNIKKYLIKHHTDVIVVNFNKDIRLGGLAARFKGGIKVIWSVGLDITKDSFIHKVLTPRLIDGVVVPSESLKSQITAYKYIANELCRVIPIGIPDTQIKRSHEESSRLLKEKYGLPEQCLIAVTSGRFVNQKGHTYLLSAAPKIMEKYPDLRFLWLGDGPLGNVLKEKLHSLGLNQYFVFAGMLDDLTLELAGADLMIHPSVEEPFGIAVLEGMRAGLPVVASRVGGLPEVVSENETALLFEPGNSDDLASKVVAILNDPGKMSVMGKAGRQRWRTEFTEAAMLDRIENYLISILENQSPAVNSTN